MLSEGWIAYMCNPALFCTNKNIPWYNKTNACKEENNTIGG